VGDTEIVVATDAGREGELIFRLIYEASQSSVPFKRLWVSSQTDEALLQGCVFWVALHCSVSFSTRYSFRDLKEGSAYDNLFKSAWCRKAADWIVGINGTKAFTIFHRGIAPFAWSSVCSFFGLSDMSADLLGAQVDAYALVFCRSSASVGCKRRYFACWWTDISKSRRSSRYCCLLTSVANIVAYLDSLLGDHSHLSRT
jgi:hypothetical protein